MTGTRFGFVPYRGGGPAMQDLVAGQIDLMIDAPATVLPQLRAGAIKVYALAAKSRLSRARPPCRPTDEAGLPGFHFSAWFAFFAPKGTPKPMVDRLNAAAVEAWPTRRARVARRVRARHFPREQQTPQAVTALQKAEIEMWWPIIKAAKIKGD